MLARLAALGRPATSEAATAVARAASIAGWQPGALAAELFPSLRDGGHDASTSYTADHEARNPFLSQRRCHATRAAAATHAPSSPPQPASSKPAAPAAASDPSDPLSSLDMEALLAAIVHPLPVGRVRNPALFAGAPGASAPVVEMGGNPGALFFDPSATLSSTLRALHVIQHTLRSDGHVLVVNSNPALRPLLKEAARLCINSNVWFWHEDWVPGVLNKNAQGGLRSVLGDAHQPSRALLAKQGLKLSNPLVPTYGPAALRAADPVPRLSAADVAQLTDAVRTGRLSVENANVRELGVQRTKARAALMGLLAARSAEARLRPAGSLNYRGRGVEGSGGRELALVVCMDLSYGGEAVQEAYDINVPTVSLLNGHSDASRVTFPVFASEAHAGFQHFFLDWMLRAVNLPPQGAGKRAKGANKQQQQAAAGAAEGKAEAGAKRPLPAAPCMASMQQQAGLGRLRRERGCGRGCARTVRAVTGPRVALPLPPQVCGVCGVLHPPPADPAEGAEAQGPAAAAQRGGSGGAGGGGWPLGLGPLARRARRYWRRIAAGLAGVAVMTVVIIRYERRIEAIQKEEHKRREGLKLKLKEAEACAFKEQRRVVELQTKNAGLEKDLEDCSKPLVIAGEWAACTQKGHVIAQQWFSLEGERQKFSDYHNLKHKVEELEKSAGSMEGLMQQLRAAKKCSAQERDRLAAELQRTAEDLKSTTTGLEILRSKLVKAEARALCADELVVKLQDQQRKVTALEEKVKGLERIRATKAEAKLRTVQGSLDLMAGKLLGVDTAMAAVLKGASSSSASMTAAILESSGTLQPQSAAAAVPLVAQELGATIKPNTDQPPALQLATLKEVDQVLKANPAPDNLSEAISEAMSAKHGGRWSCIQLGAGSSSVTTQPGAYMSVEVRGKDFVVFRGKHD
ncbi:hypothetical protein HYH03_010572 [Edaphochlamys debaryana]|uniref:Uncharacterized protein n=1 Tax=Edaphochlamys debaryana TaxID=47281 RepID=A0A835XWJ8_9CHLO|nr:hypothetical protein HYH03_010572 [Edaphochlamys debaryana]|eukprot:KAG2491129.1 hypothetical protein HYH03_010572 [Edaphochlamys debaryana]